VRCCDCEVRQEVTDKRCCHLRGETRGADRGETRGVATSLTQDLLSIVTSHAVIQEVLSTSARRRRQVRAHVARQVRAHLVSCILYLVSCVRAT
jgi:hypothetical protein